MDVQTENTDPPPCESQPSGKIRKGFKLFGKRKPGNIFSIRGKGDGNNKSPVIRSKTLDGLSEPPAPDSELEPDGEKAQEVSQGEREQAEEEPLGDDGVLAAAPARTSISSASSAKSLSFLSLLRGGRRGVGDRRAQTVCQPTGRQRRGLKGLFGSVKFRSKDKEDKEEAPPSPLLMSSRANSVEIIKEDLTLTPKSHPRSLNSPEPESEETLKSLTEQDSAAMSPSKTGLPQEKTGNVSKTVEHVSPLSTPEPPMVPGDTSLSSLLADISSLLTFDSISGGDILADVEAEWGKASTAPSTAATEVTSSPPSLFSKSAVSSCLAPASVSAAAPAKPSPVNISTKASFQPLTSPTKTTSTSSPASKPSSIITTFTKSSTLTTQSVRLSSDFTPASESTTSVKVTPPPAPAVTKPSTAPVTLASFPTPVTSSSQVTAKSAKPTVTPASLVNPPSVSPVLSSSVSRPALGTAAPPAMTSFVSKPIPVATSSSTSDKPPPVTRSPPIPTAPTQPPPNKLDLTSTFNPQTSSSYKPPLSSVGGESKAETVPSACTVTTKAPAALASVSKMTTPPMSTTTSASASVTMSKPTSSSVDLNKTSSSHVPDLSLQARTVPGPASVPTSTPAPCDKTAPLTKPPSPPAPSDKMPPTSKPITIPATQVSAASPAPTALGQVPVSQSKAPAASTHIPVSLPALTQTQVTQSKTTPSPAQLPVSVSKDLPAPTQTQLPQSKSPLPPAQIPVSVSKAPPASALTPASVTADPPAPVSVPISVSKDTPAPAQIVVPPSKAPSAPVTAPCPITSPLSTPAPGAASLHSTSTKAVQPASLKTDEQPNETQTSLSVSSREKKPAQAKSSGLSKIPVVGRGRGVKPPVRDGQHADEEPVRDPPTPVLEDEKPYFNSHNAGNKDKIGAAEAKSPTSKHSPPEESLQQPKAATSSGRDSKIPVKHGATASQTPQAKEPPRTKIPVSKVPVRRAGNKPPGPGGGTQIRK